VLVRAEARVVGLVFLTARNVAYSQLHTIGTIQKPPKRKCPNHGFQYVLHFSRLLEKSSCVAFKLLSSIEALIVGVEVRMAFEQLYKYLNAFLYFQTHIHNVIYTIFINIVILFLCCGVETKIK
jgi:hypothetical protein